MASLKEQREMFRKRLQNQPVINRPQPKPATPKPERPESRPKVKQDPIPFRSIGQEEVAMGWAKLIDHLKVIRVPTHRPELIRILDSAFSWSKLPDYPQIIDYYFQRLKKSDFVHHEEANDTYKYQFKYKLNSKEDLMKLLYEYRLENGFDVKELSESWPDVKQAMEELEKEGRCMIMKNQQDKPFRVFWNDPVLVTPMDPQLMKMWDEIKAPDDVESELNKTGLKGVQVAPKEKQEVVKKKRKQGQRKFKITNTHLQDLGIDLTKDYQFGK